MIKDYLFAGIVLLIVGVVVLYSVSSYVTSGTPTSIVNVTVPASKIGDVPILVNASAISIVFAFASNSTDIYFLNQSSFNGLSGYLSGNSAQSAYSFVLSQNISKSDIFENSTSAVKENYQTSNSNANQYYIYAIIDSTKGSPSYNETVNASVIYKAYSFGSWEGNSIESLFGLAAIILGVALLIYGAIKKPKTAAVAAGQDVEAPKGKKRAIKG